LRFSASAVTKGEAAAVAGQQLPLRIRDTDRTCLPDIFIQPVTRAVGFECDNEMKINAGSIVSFYRRVREGQYSDVIAAARIVASKAVSETDRDAT
jgi:hypothetical protein